MNAKDLKVNWIVEDTEKVGDLTPLKTAIVDSGGVLHNIKPNYFEPSDIIPKINEIKGPTIAYGTIAFIGLLRKSKISNSYPLIYCKDGIYSVTMYCHILGQDYINHDYKIYPLKDLNNRPFPFEESKSLFIRPIGGYKDFAGYTVEKNDYHREIKNLISSTMWASNLLVLLAPAKDIIEEYRFVVAKNKVVAGSTYIRNEIDNEDEQEVELAINDSDLVNYANQIAAKITSNTMDFDPDPVYTLDIAKLKDGFKVVELNSFSCSGLYACDKNRLVNRVNQVVLEDYFDTFYQEG